SWRETKVACCLSLSSQESAADPQPEPPSKFLEPAQVAALAAGVKSRGRPARGRTAETGVKPRRKKKRRRPSSKKRVRTVVASMANSETFGWQMATEVQRRAAAQLGKPSPNAADADPRHIVSDTLGYVENNRTRMDYPRYRRLGLPISSAPVESTIKLINRRVKGSEKFWLDGGAEAILQL